MRLTCCLFYSIRYTINYFPTTVPVVSVFGIYYFTLSLNKIALVVQLWCLVQVKRLQRKLVILQDVPLPMDILLKTAGRNF